MDGDLTCQSGARWEQINDTLRDNSIPLFFPVSTHIVCGSANLTFDSLTLDQALYVLSSMFFLLRLDAWPLDDWRNDWNRMFWQ
jgi:hypothetical protein